MADSLSESVLGHLNNLLSSAATAADDGRLLECFVHHRDEAAFAELVARHGPLVMGLCRRLLGNTHDAEDVFQATFFVLARKAAAIRKPESLSCWLHGVASRLALDLWGTASGKLLHSFAGHREGVSGLAFAADGKTLFSVAGLSDAKLLAWDTATGGLRDQHGEFAKGYHGLSLSPDGKLLAVCGDRSLEVWDAASRKKLHDCESLNFSWTEPGVCVAWSADCRLLISSGHVDRNVRVWDATTGKQRGAIAANQDYPAEIALSPNGAMAAVGGYHDGTIRMWSVATGKELRKLATQPKELRGEFVRPGRTRVASMASALAFHPDGAILASGGLEGDLHLWDAATGRLLRRWETKASWIRQLAFSRDGRTLITGHSDRTAEDASRVYLWEAATGQQRACYSGHRGPILSVAFAPDDRRVASGSEDTTILIWATTGEPRRDAELPAEQLRSLWGALIGTDADRAYRSIWRLALTPKHSLPFLGEQLRRIARLEEEHRSKLPRLIEDLDDERFIVREKAERELAKMGSLVEPALRQALEAKPSLEMRRRIEMVLEKTAGWSGERLRALRALEAIEHMNTPEARQLVEALANGEPHAWLSGEARAIRRRLAEQSVATRQR
jgi:WD40 repeat protein